MIYYSRQRKEENNIKIQNKNWKPCFVNFPANNACTLRENFKGTVIKELFIELWERKQNGMLRHQGQQVSILYPLSSQELVSTLWKRDTRMQWGLVLGTFMGNKVSPFCGSTEKEASRQEILQRTSQSSTDECGYGIKERGGKSQHTCQSAHCLHKNTKGKRRPSYKRRKPWFECRICIEQNI